MGHSESDNQDIVQLLRDAQKGSTHALDALLPIVYEEMRNLASVHLHHERMDHTLQPTALVHEAYLRLTKQHSLGCEDRTQFFAAAATVMRRVLVDHARARNATKRGGSYERTHLDDVLDCVEQRAIDMIELNEALTRLEAFDAQKSKIVELRFFGGLTVRETSDMLDIPIRTIEREWTMAKAWLRSELTKIGYDS